MLIVFHLYEKNLKKCDTCDTLGVALHEYAFFSGRSFFFFFPGFCTQGIGIKRDAVCNVIKLRSFTSLDMQNDIACHNNNLFIHSKFYYKGCRYKVQHKLIKIMIIRYFYVEK